MAGKEKRRELVVPHSPFANMTKLEFRAYRISVRRRIKYYEASGDNVNTLKIRRRLEREQQEWRELHRQQKPDKMSEYRRIQDLLSKRQYRKR